MSTVFFKKREQKKTGRGAAPDKKGAGHITAGRGIETGTEQGLQCALCRGELYPGDVYFELDGKTVCEDCLGRYARDYFAPSRRRVGGRKTGALYFRRA